MLLEPVVPTRRQFDTDLTEIAAKFGSYRYAMENTADGRVGELVVYVTPGGDAAQRVRARDLLEPFAHQVVDTTDLVARGGFLSKIENLGGGRQQSL